MAPPLPACVTDLNIAPELRENALCGVADASLQERLRADAGVWGLRLWVAFPVAQTRHVTAGRTPLSRSWLAALLWASTTKRLRLMVRVL